MRGERGCLAEVARLEREYGRVRGVGVGRVAVWSDVGGVFYVGNVTWGGGEGGELPRSSAGFVEVEVGSGGGMGVRVDLVRIMLGWPRPRVVR